MNRRAQRFLLVSLGVLVSLVLAEVGVRLTLAGRPDPGSKLAASENLSPPPCGGDCAAPAEQARLGEMLKPSSVPDLIYELKPGLDTCYEGSRVVTNSAGLRADQDYEVPKPAGTYRILLLGDSQTFGQGVEFEETFGQLLEQSIEKNSRGWRVEVINSGVDGYNTAQQAAYLEGRGMAYEPDLVVLLFIGNDLELPQFLLEPADPLALNTLYLLEFLRGRGEPGLRVPAKFAHLEGFDAYLQALRQISSLANENGIPVVNFLGTEATVLGDHPEAVRWEEISELQRQLGIVSPAFAIPWGPKWWLSEQNHHLNAQGHREVSRMMLEGMVDSRVIKIWEFPVEE